MTEPVQAPRFYRAFGLVVRSDFLLPELPPAADRTNVDLDIRRVPERPAPPARSITFGRDSAEIKWPIAGSFRVLAGGREIEIEPAEGVGDELIALPTLGPVLAIALHLRGCFTLHASAIDVGGAGAVFMGDKGAGKSTTAAALLSRGHHLIADDLAAFDEPLRNLLPAYPQIRLTDESLARLDAPGATLRKHPGVAIYKNRILISRFSNRPVPVSRLYIVERGAETRILVCAPDEALRAILRFAYAARFGRPALSGALAARHFRQSVALADGGAVRRLVLPDGLDRLPAAIARIEEDLAPDVAVDA